MDKHMLFIQTISEMMESNSKNINCENFWKWCMQTAKTIVKILEKYAKTNYFKYYCDLWKMHKNAKSFIAIAGKSAHR